MGLHEWQRELSAMVTAPRGTGPTLVEEGLTVEERRWLQATAEDPGLRVTRHAQRSWRVVRLLNALPLTMVALPAATRDAVINAYLDEVPCVSFFHAHEGRGFARFLVDHRPVVGAHALSLAAFEVAVADAMEHPLFARDEAEPGPLTGESILRMHPAATVVVFAAAPEQVIAAAIAGTEPPPLEDAPHALLVAPGLPSLTRALRPDELGWLEACNAGLTVNELVEDRSERMAWVEQMLAQGALACTPSPPNPVPRSRRRGSAQRFRRHRPSASADGV